MNPFDTHGAFRANVDKGEVRRLAIRGAGVTVLSSGLALAIQIIATVFLARLLTPMDFGLVTMVTTFSLLFVNFGLNGFTEAILQWPEIDRFLVSNLFWINTSIGLLLSVAFAAAGSLMARFYHEPLVARVALGVAPSIFLTSLSVEHIALLKRAMCFTATSVNEIIARAISLVLSIFLAWAGWGYWALVAGVVAQPVAQSIGAWFLCPWLPSFPRRIAGTGAMMRFVFNVYSRFTVSYFGRNTDNLLVGWRFGSISLGFYKKAYDLFALSATQLTAPITNVAVSALSRFNPRSKQYMQHLLSALSVTAFVGLALSAEFTLIGKNLIRVLLGPGWDPAGRIFTFFAPGIGAMLIYYVHSWIHLSIGRADRWLRWGIVEVVVTCLSFVLALPWGPVGVAIAWSTSIWILIIPAIWYAGRPIQFGIGRVLATIWKYAASAVLAGFGAAGIFRLFPALLGSQHSAMDGVAAMAAVSFVFVVFYLAAVALLHGGLAPIYQVARLLGEMTSKSKSTGPISTSAETVDTNASTGSI